MRISKKEYDLIDKTVCDIYIDYNINFFPVDIYKLCKKMGITIKYYSSYDLEERKLLLKKSNDGFYCKSPIGHLIFINDYIENEGRIIYTIAHEIKHYIFGDEGNDEKEEKMADHFARFLLCPTPYLIYKKIYNPSDIARIFKISYEAAVYTSKAVINRKDKYENKLFAYELQFIKLFGK